MREFFFALQYYIEPLGLPEKDRTITIPYRMWQQLIAALLSDKEINAFADIGEILEKRDAGGPIAVGHCFFQRGPKPPDLRIVSSGEPSDV